MRLAAWQQQRLQLPLERAQSLRATTMLAATVNCSNPQPCSSFIPRFRRRTPVFAMVLRNAPIRKADGLGLIERMTMTIQFGALSSD